MTSRRDRPDGALEAGEPPLVGSRLVEVPCRCGRSAMEVPELDELNPLIAGPSGVVTKTPRARSNSEEIGPGRNGQG